MARRRMAFGWQRCEAGTFPCAVDDLRLHGVSLLPSFSVGQGGVSPTSVCIPMAAVAITIYFPSPWLPTAPSCSCQLQRASLMNTDLPALGVLDHGHVVADFRETLPQATSSPCASYHCYPNERTNIPTLRQRKSRNTPLSTIPSFGILPGILLANGLNELPSVPRHQE